METFTYSTDSIQHNFIESVVAKLKEVFGEDLASPEHEPIRFNYQMSIIKSMLK